jgi:GntR family transcriptional regulator
MSIGKERSPIEFRLDPSSGVPTYLQLVQQVEHALRLGYLKPGDQLKAYKELETKGLTEGRPGQGTFITATLEQVTLPDLAALRRTLTSWLASADAAGLDEDGAAALFTSVLRDFYKERSDASAPANNRTRGVEGVA